MPKRAAGRGGRDTVALSRATLSEVTIDFSNSPWIRRRLTIGFSSFAKRHPGYLFLKSVSLTILRTLTTYADEKTA